MKVDLSKHELDLLDQALVAWQQQPTTEAFGSTMMKLILEREPTSKESAKAQLKPAEDERNRRERVALLLRAKLMQASSVESEHDLATTTSQTGASPDMGQVS